MSEGSVPNRKSLDAFLWSIHIFAKYANNGLETPAGFQAYHDIIYGPANLETIPEDSIDGKLLAHYGWHPQDDCWVWFT